MPKEDLVIKWFADPQLASAIASSSSFHTVSPLPPSIQNNLKTNTTLRRTSEASFKKYFTLQKGKKNWNTTGGTCLSLSPTNTNKKRLLAMYVRTRKAISHDVRKIELVDGSDSHVAWELELRTRYLRSRGIIEIPDISHGWFYLEKGLVGPLDGTRRETIWILMKDLTRALDFGIRIMLAKFHWKIIRFGFCPRG